MGWKVKKDNKKLKGFKKGTKFIFIGVILFFIFLFFFEFFRYSIGETFSFIIFLIALLSIIIGFIINIYFSKEENKLNLISESLILSYLLYFLFKDNLTHNIIFPKFFDCCRSGGPIPPHLKKYYIIINVILIISVFLLCAIISYLYGKFKNRNK